MNSLPWNFRNFNEDYILHEDYEESDLECSVSLPNLPSELIRLALRDLKACEKHKDYKVEMGTWHAINKIEAKKGKPKKVCSVCFAGSVMANTLRIAADKFVTPASFIDDDITHKLQALNWFRLGDISQGLGEMGYDYHFPIQEVPYYEYDKKGFHKAMEKIALALELVGL